LPSPIAQALALTIGGPSSGSSGSAFVAGASAAAINTKPSTTQRANDRYLIRRFLASNACHFQSNVPLRRIANGLLRPAAEYVKFAVLGGA
jgi:hypothetical protein